MCELWTGRERKSRPGSLANWSPGVPMSCPDTLGCHAVGERAIDIVQVAAVAMAGGMRVDDLARIPLSFPTYAGILVNAAAGAARELNLMVSGQAYRMEGPWH